MKSDQTQAASGNIVVDFYPTIHARQVPRELRLAIERVLQRQRQREPTAFKAGNPLGWIEMRGLRPNAPKPEEFDGYGLDPDDWGFRIHLDQDEHEPVGVALERATKLATEIIARGLDAVESKTERDDIRSHIALRLRPFTKDPKLTTPELVATLFEIDPTKCTFKDDNDATKVVPFCIGEPVVELKMDPHAPSPPGGWTEAQLIAWETEFSDQCNETIGAGWMLDPISTVSKTKTRPALLSPKPDGFSAHLLDVDAPVARWALGYYLEKWGKAALGQSVLRSQMPKKVFAALEYDEKWIFEEAATLYASHMLPTPLWAPEDERSGWQAKEFEKALGHAFDEMRSFDDRNLYNSVKRLAGLLEYRIRFMNITCDGKATPNKQRHGCSNKVSFLWHYHVLGLSDADGNRVRQPWCLPQSSSSAGLLRSKVRDSEIRLEEFIDLGLDNLDNKLGPLGSPSDGIASWAGRLQAAILGATVNVKKLNAATFTLGGLGAIVVEVRNLLEHKIPKTILGAGGQTVVKIQVGEKSQKALDLPAGTRLVVDKKGLLATIRLLILFYSCCQESKLLGFGDQISGHRATSK